MDKLIQVMGPGCPKCEKLKANAEAAAKELGLEAQVEKVTDINVMVGFGIMATPALVVDGVVKSIGKVLSVEEVKRLLQSGAA